MGMDSYLYKTTKDEHESYLKYIEEYDRVIIEIDRYCKELNHKYGDDLFKKDREEIIKLITPEELSCYHKLLEQTHYEHEECEKNELMYWRKAYGLHKFICRYFLKNGRGDNCERIPLTKENIQEIINEMKRCRDNFKEMSDDCIFGRDNLWDISDLDYNIYFFQNVLNNEFSDDTVIYYYSWY